MTLLEMFIQLNSNSCKAIHSINKRFIVVGLLALTLLFSGISAASAATITVDDSGSADYTTIQAAVDAASDGDTILVSPGTYNENVIVDNKLTITSTDGAEKTKIRGVSEDYVLTVTANDVTIDGFNITGIEDRSYETDDGWSGSAGVYINSNNCNVSDNFIMDTSFGVYVLEGEDNTIKENKFSNNRRAIGLQGSDNNIISNNFLPLEINGIYYYCNNAVHMISSDSNTIKDNSFGLIRGNVIVLENSNSNLISGNLLDNDDSGWVMLVSGNENTVENNNIGGGAGVSIEGDYNTLDGNKVGSLDYAFLIQGRWNTIQENTISYSTGIVLSSFGNNVVENNVIYDSWDYGISLANTANNEITGNIVTGSKESGRRSGESDGSISLSDSNNNLIHNNLFNSTVNVAFEGTNTGNQWNIDKTSGTNIVGGDYLGGNYWAKPDGTGFSQENSDSDGDGICESPCTLDADNIDNLPLTLNTVTPSPSPSPEITGVVVEPQLLSEGDTATVKISVINNGGPSSNGFIAVSFPDDEEILDVSGTGSDYNKLFPVGSSIVTSTGSSITSTDPLVELHDLDWKSGQTETLTIKVKTNKDASELRFYVRATLREEDVANYIRTPVSSSITDQQGFYVNEYFTDVTVNQAPTASIISISPDTVVEGITVFFSGNGEDTDGTISNWNWKSSIDGNLSSSASFSTSNLSIGTHTIYFSVCDNDGEWSEEASRTLTVNEITAQNGDDSAVPVLVNVTPADGSILDADTSSVEVLFNYKDEQSNISSSSVVLIFDNIDVTADANATITDSYASYTASGLSTGSHSASVYVVDNSGNAVIFSTGFTISKASSSSSSSGGGGGGGGGSTGESYSNIADKEVDSVFVTTGSHVAYGFSNPGNPITTVEFDSKKTAGTIQATVEVLKDTSALVDEDAPGEIYQRMNIWVGKVGYATESNVENMIVAFKVEKSWLDENNVPAESVSLYRYSDDTWNLLPTEVSREDDEYVYFSSSTPGFSPFTISGESEETVMSTTDKTVDASVVESIDVENDDAESTSGGVNAAGLVIILILLSAILVGGYALSKKKD